MRHTTTPVPTESSASNLKAWQTAASRMVLSSDACAFLILLLLALSAWGMHHAFFWMDDWGYLSALREPNLAWYFEDHNGHLIPLHKLLFHAQLLLFGTNTDAFEFLNVVFFALGTHAVYRLVRDIHTPTTAWVTAIALTLHPMMCGHVAWSFQQGLTLHILFQTMAVHAFIRWARDRQQRDMLLAASHTVIQNYFFGNGVFVPLLLAFGTILFTDGQRATWRSATMFTLLFLTFVAIQLIAGGNRTGQAISGLSIPGIAFATIHMAGLDAARFFFVRETLAGPATLWIGLLLLVTAIGLMLLRGTRDRRIGWFIAAWYITSLITIPLALGENIVMRDGQRYYSALCAVPMALIVAHAIHGLRISRLIPAQLSTAALLVVAIAFFLIDRQMVETYSFRNFRNRQQMYKAIERRTDYVSFDDWAIILPNSPIHDARGTYEYWLARDMFRSPFGYSNTPSNWTMERSLTPTQ